LQTLRRKARRGFGPHVVTASGASRDPCRLGGPRPRDRRAEGATEPKAWAAIFISGEPLEVEALDERLRKC